MNPLQHVDWLIVYMSACLDPWQAPETAALQAELSKKANLLEKAKGLLDKVEGQLVKKTKEVGRHSASTL